MVVVDEVYVCFRFSYKWRCWLTVHLLKEIRPFSPKILLREASLLPLARSSPAMLRVWVLPVIVPVSSTYARALTPSAYL